MFTILPTNIRQPSPTPLKITLDSIPCNKRLQLPTGVPIITFHISYARRLSQQSNVERGRRLSSGQDARPYSATYPSAAYSNVNPNAYQPKCSKPLLPSYIKPLPPRIAGEDVIYLANKGALSIPDTELRDELLRSYVEFVHGYMPLLDLNSFLMIVDREDGSLGSVSLLLFQAVMFAATAFVDLRHLQNAGFESRREARKVFFQKARLLYDFDYEVDRVTLVQALLLMTYWYETPNDQKDTWHWMGVAISLSHTIGLHRNPEKSNMDPKRQSLWKRIWWSCYMRDRLVALGMRRPTRIKTEDFDVPMLTLADFQLEALPSEVSCISYDCSVARNIEHQRQLAVMCIEKAKLSLCISRVLSVQYSVLNNNQGALTPEGHTQTTMMLLPKKSEAETHEVEKCDLELVNWVQDLPEFARYRTPESADLPAGDDVLTVHRALLHMVYFTTLSALHRPQVLPSAPSAWSTRDKGSAMQELSRRQVRAAAAEITSTAQDLHDLDLVRYLPTTGTTVLLPAVIVHLLDVKSPDEETRNTSLQGFYQCMQVMQRLRETYAAADFAMQFLEAAIRKADIQVAPKIGSNKQRRIYNVEGLVDVGRQRAGLGPGTQLTPPPEATPAEFQQKSGSLGSGPDQGGNEMASKLTRFLASTPPSSDESSSNVHEGEDNRDAYRGDMFSYAANFGNLREAHHDPKANEARLQRDFDSLIDFNAEVAFGGGDLADKASTPATLADCNNSFSFGLGNGAVAGANAVMDMGMHGESSGFALDMDWMNGMQELDFVDPVAASTAADES
ncbi:MAG: hypothetical protein M4579_000448 [Chaenotheca gracillima]|nr:MAG: hypothetical protein M4579_000448 [Chaenotheca gracillima]